MVGVGVSHGPVESCERARQCGPSFPRARSGPNRVESERVCLPAGGHICGAHHSSSRNSDVLPKPALRAARCCGTRIRPDYWRASGARAANPLQHSGCPRALVSETSGYACPAASR